MVLVWVPPPHVFEHVDQELTLQSTGQLLPSVNGGHTCPPYAGDVNIDRVCVIVPFEHDDHEDHGPTRQSTGQLLDCDNWSIEGHAVPPYVASFTIGIVRRVTPFEHVDHDDQAPVMQLVEHGRTLHSREFDNVGHDVPPYKGPIVAVRV